MTGSLNDWIAGFCATHAKAKEGKLDAAEQAAYLLARDQLAGALLAGQRLNLKPGENPRRALRVARGLQVELELPTGLVPAITQDISVGGISALVPSAPPVGTRVLYKLKLGRSVDPITGAAKVVAVVDAKGAARMSLMFEELAPTDRDRLEMVVFDGVVAQLNVRAR
jgi:hypothetical protein